jgi:aminoglycoside phosphotransferase (APT) family kinase protein
MIEHLELQDLADKLGMRIIGPMTGGEFGAMLAVGDDGLELVLKTMSLPDFFTHEELASVFARGAGLAARLRAKGYPSPAYAGTGATSTFAWSLQERLPGEVPDVVTTAHARRLVELAMMHRDAAGTSCDWRTWALRRVDESLPVVAADKRTAALARELAAVFDRTRHVELRRRDVVHADFHHRNYLAIGDEITGVFDWEFALPGDWRADLVNLAFWAAVIDEQIPEDPALLIIDAALQACPPDVLGFLAAFQSIRQLDFDVRVHPERVDGIVHAIEANIAPWWREAG